MLVRCWRRCRLRSFYRRFFLVGCLIACVCIYLATLWYGGGKNKAEACELKKLEVWHPALKGFFKKTAPVNCSTEENWVYTSNGSVHMSPSAKEKHGEIVCQYVPLQRGKDDFQILYQDTITPVADGMPMVSDFFDLRCEGQDGMTYENLHAGIRRDPELQKKTGDVDRETQSSGNPLGLNILMFGFDSVSRMMWQRHLPKTQKYFTETLGGIILEGYTIAAKGTLEAQLAILTGQTMLELPEARKGFPNATTVDDFPWIWKRLKELGYATQWGEDVLYRPKAPMLYWQEAHNTFTQDMLGFKHQPVDHYLRPFYMEALKRYDKWHPFCFGSIPRYRIMLNWIREFFQIYPHKLKFSFLFNSEFTHDYYNKLQWADNDLRDFLEFMEMQGYLDNTVLILMADHGARYLDPRRASQGKYEERLPYFSFRMPPTFHKQHPNAMKNLRTNGQRLTTPFDVHATFQEIINFTGAGLGDVKERGISLFKEVPKERTCADAGVEPHWCTCVSWVDVDVGDPLVWRAGESLLETINNITQDNREECVELWLDKITSAAKFTPNDKMLKFKNLQTDGVRLDLSDDTKVSEVLYQVTITTKPNLGQYEATVKYLLKQDSFRANVDEISRYNRYGTDPHCIIERLPHLRPYCFCKVQLNNQ